MRQVKAGSGFLSTSQVDPLFGVGAAKAIELLEIHWPAGEVQILQDIAVNQRIHLEEKTR